SSSCTVLCHASPLAYSLLFPTSNDAFQSNKFFISHVLTHACGGWRSQNLETQLFFHSGDVLAVSRYVVSMQRWPDAQKKFKGVTEIVSVVAIESVRATVDGELRAEPDVDAVA